MWKEKGQNPFEPHRVKMDPLAVLYVLLKEDFGGVLKQEAWTQGQEGWDSKMKRL